MARWLIIDDDPEDQEIFELALENVDSSIELIKAFNGWDGLNKLKGMDALPNLIFLDLNMGVMDGRECIVELKRDGNLSQIPVVIYSTSSDQRDVTELTNLGAARFITKPTDVNRLMTILGEIAQTYHS